ncbi:hypothetical protein Lal_00027405 [Lupinus albus]|nr:hypothetical protein Lal_00027405 [Lupinus albus]
MKYFHWLETENKTPFETVISVLSFIYSDWALFGLEATGLFDGGSPIDGDSSEPGNEEGDEAGVGIGETGEGGDVETDGLGLGLGLPTLSSGGDEIGEVGGGWLGGLVGPNEGVGEVARVGAGEGAWAMENATRVRMSMKRVSAMV